MKLEALIYKGSGQLNKLLPFHHVLVLLESHRFDKSLLWQEFFTFPSARKFEVLHVARRRLVPFNGNNGSLSHSHPTSTVSTSFRHNHPHIRITKTSKMKRPRIISMLLAALFASAGISEAAVIRRQTDEAAPVTLKMDQRPVAIGSANGSQDDSSIEVMKKKKKKKKKTRAS